MLIYLIALSLAFACPVLALLITLSLTVKYRHFVNVNGIDVKTVVLNDSRYGQWTWLQIIFLVLSTLLSIWLNLKPPFSELVLFVYFAIAIWLVVMSWLAINQKHTQIDVQALENDSDIDDDMIRMFVEKRTMALKAAALLIMFVNISAVLLLL